jgi:hypothetical protein
MQDKVKVKVNASPFHFFVHVYDANDIAGFV